MVKLTAFLLEKASPMSEVSKFVIKKGFDLNLLGKPDTAIDTIPSGSLFKINGSEFKGVKPRIKVKEGDIVKIGTILFENKGHEDFKVVSPVAGVVKNIVLGERRVLEQITIEENGNAYEEFQKYNLNSILTTNKEELLAQLYSSGAIAYIKERPFSIIPIKGTSPKSIFINGMNTGPFQTDFSVVIKGNEEAFQIGLSLMSRLTEGQVHLCLSDEHVRFQKLPQNILNVNDIQVNTFKGPHPSGNTSVHINELDPINVGDKVWTIKAIDLVQIGRLFQQGRTPTDKIICIGGEGIRENARKHYKVRIGASLDTFFSKNLEAGEQRIIAGVAPEARK